jgi:hypothetical protein
MSNVPFEGSWPEGRVQQLGGCLHLALVFILMKALKNMILMRKKMKLTLIPNRRTLLSSAAETSAAMRPFAESGPVV